MNATPHPQISGSGQTWAKSEDWDRVRLHIKRLYVNENKTLGEVMTTMTEQYGHHGTEKMYKSRIKKWELQKNVKRSDMLSILHEINDETTISKETRFRVRRRVVTYDEVLRYFERTGGTPELARREVSGSPDTLLQMAIPTPTTSDVSELSVARLGTNSSDPSSVPLSLTPPSNLLILEGLFSSIKNYFDGSFSNMSWRHDEENGHCIWVDTTATSVDTVHQLRDYCRMAVMFVKMGSWMQYGYATSKICSLAEDILTSHEPTALEILLHSLLLLIREGFANLACDILKFISATAAKPYLLDQSDHPLKKIWSLLLRADINDLETAAVESWHCIYDSFEKHLGSLHRTTSHSYLKFLEVAHTSDIALAERTLRTRLAEFTRQLDKSDPRVLNLMACLGNNLYLQQRYYEAEDIAKEILKQGSKVKGSIAEICALQLMAEAQHMLGRRDLAVENLREAVRRIRLRWHYSHPWATKELVMMRSWLQEWGSSERDVTELDHEIISFIRSGDYEEQMLG